MHRPVACKRLLDWSPHARANPWRRGTLSSVPLVGRVPMPPSSQYTHSRGPPPTGCIRAAHNPTARSVRLRAHAPPCAEVVCCDLLAFLQDPARPVCPTAATRRQDPDGASRAGSHLLILHTGTAVQRSFHVGFWHQAERPRCACAWRPCGRGRVCASRHANAKCRWCNLYCSAAWCLSCSAAWCSDCPSLSCSLHGRQGQMHNVRV